VEQVVDRGVIAPVAENEPLSGNNVASKEAGAGLPPTIPPGMRAISVKVNEVIGVAGFVVPGTRVDVMAIVRESNKSLARVVVSNVQVLAAGTRYDQEVAREGKALPGTSVVTLMVSPADAELIGLAATEGQLMLTLRNPLDTTVTPSSGTYAARLAGDEPPPKAASSGASARRAAPAPTPTPTPAPPPPPKRPVVIKAGVVGRGGQ
jgi:pilus assembly protein CpaB